MSLREEVEAFLYREAKLLDERRYEEWMALFTEDGVYSLPSGLDAGPQRSVMLVHDDRRRLGERLVRMQNPAFWAQQPPTGTTRLIGNVLATPAGEHEIEAECRLLVVTLRRQRQDLLSGSAHYRLRTGEDGLRIREKVVRLLQRDLPFDNLTFLP